MIGPLQVVQEQESGTEQQQQQQQQREQQQDDEEERRPGDDDDDDNNTEEEEEELERPVRWWSTWTSQYSWRRYVQYNMMLRVRWIIRHQDGIRSARCRARGISGTRMELRVRKFKHAKVLHDDTQPCKFIKEEDDDDDDDAGLQGSTMKVTDDTDDDDDDINNDDNDIDSLEEPHCTICFVPLQEGDKIGDLGCPHTFHAECLTTWVARRNACPLCAVPIAQRRRIPSEELEAMAAEAAEAEGQESSSGPQQQQQQQQQGQQATSAAAQVVPGRATSTSLFGVFRRLQRHRTNNNNNSNNNNTQ